MRLRLVTTAAVVVATLIGLAGPAAALPPITTPVQPTPCYLDPGLCFYAEPNHGGFTAWSFYDITNTPYYTSIWNVTTKHVLENCTVGTSCTADPPAREYPAPGQCMAYVAYIGSLSSTFPPPGVQRRSSLVQLCG